MDIFNNAQKAWLLLEDGTLYEGYGLGCAVRMQSVNWCSTPAW